MSSCSEVRTDKGPPIDVALLTSVDVTDWRTRHGGGHHLPYRLDHLTSHGLALRWTDAVHRPGWRSSTAAGVVARVESVAAPFAQTAALGRTIAAAPVTLAMFESEGHTLAALRSARRSARPGRPGRGLAVVSCWLAEILPGLSAARRRAYRWAYRGVDRVVYFSENQGAVLGEHLGLGPDRLRFVPFGVDHETFRPPAEGAGEDGVLVVGRDRSRDWPTLLAAVDGLDLPVTLCCRPADLPAGPLPANVDLRGYVALEEYRHLLGRARVVVVATRPTAYPGGQTVALEAMAMGRALVATATPALAGDLEDGVTALTVPPADPAALRERIALAAGDDGLRRRLGRAARCAVEGRNTASAMWAVVARDLRDLAERAPR